MDFSSQFPNFIETVLLTFDLSEQFHPCLASLASARSGCLSAPAENPVELFTNLVYQ